MGDKSLSKFPLSSVLYDQYIVDNNITSEIVYTTIGIATCFRMMTTRKKERSNGQAMEMKSHKKCWIIL